MSSKKYSLTGKQWKALEPFFYRKAAKQRLILYLIARGYTVPELIQIKVSDIRKLTVEHEIQLAIDESLAGIIGSALAFQYPDGRPMPHTSYYRLIRYASKSAVKKPFSQIMLYKYIKNA